MLEIRYKKNGEWFTLPVVVRSTIAHGEKTNDPSYVLDYNASFVPPEGAEEFCVKYLLEDGEDVVEDSFEHLLSPQL